MTCKLLAAAPVAAPAVQTSERVPCQVDLKTYASESERTGHMVLSYNGTWSMADLRNVPPTLLAWASRERLPRTAACRCLVKRRSKSYHASSPQASAQRSVIIPPEAMLLGRRAPVVFAVGIAYAHAALEGLKG